MRREDVRELPKNIEAEEVVLGSALLEPETTIPKIAGILNPSLFYDSRHKIIYKTMIELFDRGDPADIIVLANRLEEKGVMGSAGGRIYLNHLLDRTTTTASLEWHAKIVRRKGVRRNILDAAARVAEAAYIEDDGDLDNLQSMCEDLPLLFAGEADNGIKTLADISHGAHDEMIQIIDRGWRGIPCGHSNVDYFTRGFQPGIYVLAARPGMGKTTMMLDWAYMQAKLIHPDTRNFIRPGIVSIEMDDRSLFKRLVSREMGKDWEIVRVEGEKLVHMRELAHACSVVEKHGVFIDDYHHNSIQTVITAIYKMIVQHKVDIIYIDYIQLLGNAKASNNREQEVAGVMRRLVEIRKKFKIPIVVLAQLNRECESTKTKRPMLSHLRESGSIEQDADVVMFLYDPHEYFEIPEDVPQELVFSKNRHGRKGTAYMSWSKPTYRFFDNDYVPIDGADSWIDKAKAKVG